MLATRILALTTKPISKVGTRQFCLTNAKDYKAEIEKDKVSFYIIMADNRQTDNSFVGKLKDVAEKVKETAEEAGQKIAKAGYTTSDELVEKGRVHHFAFFINILVKRVAKPKPAPKTEGEAIARETVR